MNEPISFRSLLEQYRVEIPALQRDYAQGRMGGKVPQIRERFLNDLFTALTKDTPLALDFVYGEVKGAVFVPVDGQQRLTTLFLLHYYLALKEHQSVEGLKNFSYAVRPATQQFCAFLLGFAPTFEGKLSEEIKNSSAFQSDWLYDPTVESMLVMLDAIDSKFEKATGNLWACLDRITFYLLTLPESFGSSNDLYIKMNARGKRLTDFECFKAEFEQVIGEVLKDEEQCLVWKKSLDVKWADMLFPYKGGNNIIDDEFMNLYHFITHMLCLKYGVEEKGDDRAIAEALYNTPERLHELQSILDALCGRDIAAFFDSCFYLGDAYADEKVKLFDDKKTEKTDLFELCLRDKLKNSRNRLLLWGAFYYFQHESELSFPDFKRRIRAVRNLAYQYNEPADKNIALKIQETEHIVLTGIVSSLESCNAIPGADEEVVKLLRKAKHPELVDAFNRLEDNDYLQGSLAVIGVENVDNLVSQHFNELFSDSLLEGDRCGLISRALLSFRDYSQCGGWDRQMLGAYDNWTWPFLFHHVEDENFKNIQTALLCLLHEPDMSDITLKKCVERYLNSTAHSVYDWRYYLLTYADYGVLPDRDYCHSGFYSGNLLYSHIMLDRQRFSGQNWNIFLRVLAQKYGLDYPSADRYYGNGQWHYLPIPGTDFELDCTTDCYNIYTAGDHGEPIKTIPIPQKDGIDMVDRIELGTYIINNLSKYIKQ